MTPRPSTEQLLVQVLMRSTQEVLLCAAGAAEEAPLWGRTVEDVRLAFAPIWKRVPYLVLEFGQDGVEWEGAVVQHQAEDEAGLASMLVESGIHAVTFVPGVEKEEIDRFLGVLDRVRRLDVEGELDLVTMLFREDFEHIRYTVGSAKPAPTERPDEEPETGTLDSLDHGPAALDGGAIETVVIDGTRPAPSGSLGIREAVRTDATVTDRAQGIVQLEKFDSTLYFLDQAEIEYLRAAIKRQYADDEVRSVLALLLDTLQLRSEPEVRDQVIDVLKTLMPYLLGTGRFDSVAYLIGEIRDLAKAIDFEPRHKEALDSLRVSVSQSRALAQLFHALDAGDVESTPEALQILLRELNPDAIQNVLVWVGHLHHAEAKRALLAAIDAFFTEWPGALSRMLTASDRTVVHRALRLAGRLKLPDFVEMVAATLEVDQTRTRELAARALAAIGTSSSMREIVDLISDPEEDVRRVVLRAFAQRPYRGAETRLRRAMDARNLEGRDIAERRELFWAYGAVAGAAGVATLEPILFGKGSLARRPSSETRACAAVALGVIGTPAARFALEKATKERDPVVRSAAGAALRKERSM